MKTLGQLFTGQQNMTELPPHELQRLADEAAFAELKNTPGVAEQIPAAVQELGAAVLAVRAAQVTLGNQEQPRG